MSRRRSHQQDTDSGNDSFLDILANLVGILVILVVVVAIRVQQTVPAPSEPVVEASRPDAKVEFVRPLQPEIIRLGPEDLPINVSFAAPVAEVEAEPKPSSRLQLELAALEGELKRASGRALPEADASQLAKLRVQNASIRNELAEHNSYVSATRRSLEEQRLRYADVERNIGRAVAKLEEEDDEPETEVVSLEHDVRAIAHVAGADRLHIMLSQNAVTVLPVSKLTKEISSRVSRKYHNARSESSYEGWVGPIDGVSMRYECEMTGTSAMDDVFSRSAHPLSRVRATIHMSPIAVSEPIQRALERSSEFRFALSRSDRDTTVVAYVYPDSFAAARELQKFLQSGGVALALQPLPDGVPIGFAPGGSRAMAQ